MFPEKKYLNNINWYNLKKFIINIRDQVQKKIHREGLIAIFHLVVAFILWIFALFLVALFHLLKPWVIIRIKQPRSDKIGHFAANIEIYLCERDKGINIPNQRFIDIWYYNSFVCNMQLQKMWNRVLKIWPTHLSSLIMRINSVLPNGGLYTFEMPSWDRDVHNVLELSSPHLSFTPDEEKYGKIQLDSMGVSSPSFFVCFVGRDSKYHRNNSDNYRDTNVQNYLLAAQELVNRGYYAIRMGSVVIESLASNNPRIIDYATNGQRSDFMDIYLGAKCHFFISVGTGIDAIPETYLIC